MSAVEVIGWAGTVSGTILGLPQVLRLVRTRRVDGLSLTAWRAMLVVNLIWTAHGISIGQLPQIVTSALSLCCTVPILYLMARELRRHLVPVLLPGLLAAGVLIAIDQFLGSAAFGAAAIIAAVVANAGQSIELVRAKRIVGVSVLFLILAVVNQGLWLSWAILVPDIGAMIFATVTGIITVFNLTWWSLRMLGLRPILVTGIPDEIGHTEVQPRPASTGVPTCSRTRQHRPLTIKEAPVTDIRITVNDRSLTAQLADNPTARDLVDLLPLTLRFRDFNDVEKIAKLPRPLTMEGVPAGDDPEINDIGYYAPSGDLVLYYGDVGYWNGIVRIGRLNAQDMSVIERQPDGFQLTIHRG